MIAEEKYGAGGAMALYWRVLENQIAEGKEEPSYRNSGRDLPDSLCRQGGRDLREICRCSTKEQCKEETVDILAKFFKEREHKRNTLRMEQIAQ